jgi:hypothetical protein
MSPEFHVLKQSSSPPELPRPVRDMLASAPHRGGQLNNWIFRAAKALHKYRSPDEIVDLLYAATQGEPLQRGEIERAVRRSAPGGSVVIHTADGASQPAWPGVDHELCAKIISEADGYGLYDLWERSPVRFEDDQQHSEEIIDILFPGDPLLCCGTSNSAFNTKRREDWRGQLDRLALIVPSPMGARLGVTTEQDRKISEHSKASTGPRRFLIVEGDSGTADEQVAILLHLSKHAPLVLVVHSGRRSLHGWVSCQGASEEAMLKFMRYAVSLGACRGPWTRSQFVRMPDGTRETGERQVVYFFDPQKV